MDPYFNVCNSSLKESVLSGYCCKLNIIVIDVSFFVEKNKKQAKVIWLSFESNQFHEVLA